MIPGTTSSTAVRPAAVPAAARRGRRLGAAAAAVALVVAAPLPARADDTRDAQWYLKALKVAEAQRITKGAGVIVAVVDTGVDADHPDLKGAVLGGVNTAREGDKGNRDTEGHGTGMASIIAGRGRSGGRGLLGIAPGAKILPARPARDGLVAAKGIEFAVDNGAKVINMSFGLDDGERMRAAIRKAVAADVVLVASAGNEGDKANKVNYPAGYPEVLSVASTDRDGKVLKFSGHGDWVDLAAPGIDMEQAGVEGSYRNGFGTSNSAAVVSGAAALIRAKYPDLTAPQVVDRLLATAQDKGDKGRDDFYGHGELDLVEALTAPQPAASSAPAPADVPAGGPTQGASSDDDSGGIPPLVFILAGLLLLVIAVLAVVMALRRSRT